MTPEEQAVVEAARKIFMTSVNIESAETFLHDGVCTWMTPALASAVRRLDGYPPYGTRLDVEGAAKSKRAHEGYARWRAEQGLPVR